MQRQNHNDGQMPYNANPDLAKMRQDIADRNYNLRIKRWMIMGGLALAGAALGAMVLPLLMPGALLMGVLGGAALGMAAGGPLAELMTMKEQKMLKIDEEMVESYMQGKNHWGAGYRQEVAEYGYGGEQLPAPRNNLTPRGVNPPVRR